MALRSVAVIVQEPIAIFEYAVIAEVFGMDRRDDGIDLIDYRVCAEQPGSVDAGQGTRLDVPFGLEATRDVDVVAVPSSPAARAPSEAICHAIRDAVDRGAWVLSVCNGAFTLGAAGVLDGRRCTTHWMHTDDLARAFPRAEVDPDVLYVHDGNVITSAGTAAGIDAALYVVRLELGSAIATKIARRMVVPPHRDGGQRQFIERPVPATTAESLGDILTYVLDNLAAPHSVADLAARASMSPRTFARRFVAETGTTPHQWVIEQRILRVRELLEESDLAVEQIAAEVGFGSAALLRHHFTACTGVSPTVFRNQFRSTAS